MKIKLNRGALNYFRSQAKKTNLEIEAYLLGEIVSPTLLVVDKFFYPKSYKIQTKEEVQWSNEDYSKAWELADKLNKRVVGSIHSHPEGDPILSKTDYVGQATEGLRVLGICAIRNRKTSVVFWQADSALPCEIIYVGDK